MIDIKGSSEDSRAARLSNFTERRFVFDGIQCESIEAILQSLKCWNVEEQKKVCSLSAKEAKEYGQNYNNWKQTKLLWWRTEAFYRLRDQYPILITRIYNAVYDQDESFKADLLALGYEPVCHSIGNPDMCDTVLTEIEMIHHINRLRIRALGDK